MPVYASAGPEVSQPALGAVLGRLDLIVEVPAVSVSALTGGARGETSAVVRQRVADARPQQTTCFAETTVRVNAALHGRVLRRHCQLDASGTRLAEAAIHPLALSARGYDRLLKVARTIGDLAGAKNIEPPHRGEALQYRESGA